MERKIYKLSQKDLKKMINEAVEETVQDEAFMGVSFGVQARRENRVNTFKYARLFIPLAQKIVRLSAEFEKRATLIQNAEQMAPQGQTQVGQPVQESLIGTTVSAIGRKGIKNGIKIGARAGAKKAWKRVAAFSIPAVLATVAGIPQKIGQWIQRFANPAQTTPEEVIGAYGELTNDMNMMCQTAQEHPEILGATALSQETLNGPEGPGKKPFMKAGDAVNMAASMGALALGPVGVAAAAVLDAVTIAGVLASARAEQNQEGLEMVGKQYEYLNKAADDLYNALAQADKAVMGQKQSMYQNQAQQQAYQYQQNQPYSQGQGMAAQPQQGYPTPWRQIRL